MRADIANRSTTASTSALTRVAIAHHGDPRDRNSSTTADFEVCTASQARVSSKARVCPAACRAHGAATTVGPSFGQLTRGASASRTFAPDPDHTPATGDDAKAFLGLLVNEFVVFVDDDRSVV
jgi:hypothetical protein